MGAGVYNVTPKFSGAYARAQPKDVAPKGGMLSQSVPPKGSLLSQINSQIQKNGKIDQEPGSARTFASSVYTQPKPLEPTSSTTASSKRGGHGEQIQRWIGWVLKSGHEELDVTVEDGWAHLADLC